MGVVVGAVCWVEHISAYALLSSNGFCNQVGSCPCKPSTAAVFHWVVGGCRGPECVMHGLEYVMHDALPGLIHMPITSDQASLAG